MVELVIIRDGSIFAHHPLSAFPFSVGRGGADLPLNEPGVWDRHFTINLSADGCFGLVAQAGAEVLIGGEFVTSSVLRNEGVIGCGNVRLCFRFTPTRARPQQYLEVLVWLVLAGVFVAEICLLNV